MKNGVIIWSGRTGGSLSRNLVLFLFAVFTLSLAYKLYEEKHLSLDGVNYFFLVLETQDFINLAWSRRFAEYINEWPLVIAVKAGVTDIPLLIDIFSLGIMFPYLVSFSICYWSRRREDKSHLFFPLISMFFVNAIGDYDLIAEHHVMALVAWPILMLLTRKEQLSWLDGMFLWILLFGFSRLYETAIIPAAMFSVICIYKYWVSPHRRGQIISSGSFVLSIAVIIIGIYFVLNPRDAVNKNNFIDSIFLFRRNYEAMVAVSFLFVFTIGWIAPSRFSFLRNSCYLAALIPIIAYVITRSTTEYAIDANISFGSRTFTVVGLPLLLFGMVMVSFLERKTSDVGVIVLSIFLVVMTGYSLVDTKNWSGMRGEFRRLLTQNEGYVQLEETALWRDPYKDYRWDWNNTLLGLVWSYPCVNVIILNPKDAYNPVDLTKVLPLQRYLRYTDSLRVIDNAAKPCGDG